MTGTRPSHARIRSDGQQSGEDVIVDCGMPKRLPAAAQRDSASTPHRTRRRVEASEPWVDGVDRRMLKGVAAHTAAVIASSPNAIPLPMNTVAKN